MRHHCWVANKGRGCHCSHTPASASVGTERVSHQSEHAPVCCNCLLVSAAAGTSHTLQLWLLYPSPAWVSKCVPISCCFYSLLPGQGTDTWQCTCRGGAKTKAETQGQCDEGKGTEISLCSSTSHRLKSHNWLGKFCICDLVNPVSVEYLNRQKVFLQETGLALAAVDFGGKYTRELGQARVWAATTVPAEVRGTYLEVLEGLLGNWGLAVPHCGSKDTNRGGTRKILLLYFFCLFHFVQLFLLFYFLKYIFSIFTFLLFCASVLLFCVL